MKWQGRQRSRNVSDRRISGKGAIGGAGIIILLVYTLISGDPSALIGSLLNQGPSQSELSAQEVEMGEFVSVVLKDTETVWTDIFEEYDMTYQPVNLVLFTDSMNTGCGYATSSVGPFYCS